MDIAWICAFLLALLIGAVAVGVVCCILVGFVLCMRALWRAAVDLWGRTG